jgi:hypothetical protein
MAPVLVLLLCMMLVALGLWVFEELIKSQADIECHPFASARCGHEESESTAALWLKQQGRLLVLYTSPAA